MILGLIFGGRPAMRRCGGLGVAVALVLGLAAPARAAEVLVAIAVTPTNARVTAGFSVQMKATGTFRNGTATINRDVTADAEWTTGSSRTAIVSNVDGSRGLVTGVNAGVTAISAAISVGLTKTKGSINVTVDPPRIQSLSTKPSSKKLSVGQALQFGAKITYENGQTADVTTEVAWSSTAPSIATVDPNGVATAGTVRALAIGETIIRASIVDPTTGLTIRNSDADGKTAVRGAITGLSVQPDAITLGAGMRFPIRTYLLRTDGRSNVSGSVDWTVSPSSVARIEKVTGAGGEVTVFLVALAAGNATISARDPATGSTTAPGGNATLTVGGALSGLKIDPNPIRLAIGQSRSVDVVGLLTGGGETSDLADLVEWSVADTTVATVGNTEDDKGVLVGVRQGSTNLSAREPSSGVAASAPVTVRGTVSAIEIQPSVAKVPIGQTTAFKIRATFSDGSRSSISDQCDWEVLDDSLATVDDELPGKGDVQGLALGRTTLRITCGSRVVTASLQVIGSLSGIRVTPVGFSALAGVERQFRAEGQYDDGSTKDITKNVAWSSTNPAAASVDSDQDPGSVTTIAAGTTQIVATSGGISGGADVTVIGSVVDLEIVPSSLLLPGSGAGSKLRARATYSNGTEGPLTKGIVWSSDDVSIATVTNVPGDIGTVVAGATPGSTLIRVHSESNAAVSDSIAVTVAGTLTALEITPPLAMVIPLRATRQLSARAAYSGGQRNVNVTRYVRYETSNPAVALVSNEPGSHGLVIAVSRGTATIKAVDPATGFEAAAPASVTVR